MLKQRLIGVVTVKDGWAVQSRGFNQYLPLGKPECLIENLDRWGADEIVVQLIDRTQQNLRPDFQLLGKVAKLGLSTPLVYGGGIVSSADAVDVIQAGADRVMVDGLLRSNPQEVHRISDLLGTQAVIASVPVAMEKGQLAFYDYAQRQSFKPTAEFMSLLQDGGISEVLLQDWPHEGFDGAFDFNLIEAFPNTVPLIVFGGLSTQETIARAMSSKRVSAVAVGNFLSYKEHSIQWLRSGLGSSVRSANFRFEGKV